MSLVRELARFSREGSWGWFLMVFGVFVLSGALTCAYWLSHYPEPKRPDPKEPLREVFGYRKYDVKLFLRRMGMVAAFFQVSPRVRVYGCFGFTGVRMYGCTGDGVQARVLGCTGVRVYGCMGVQGVQSRVFGYTGVRVYGCEGVQSRVLGCSAVRMFGCLGVRVYGCSGIRLFACSGPGVRVYGCTGVQTWVYGC